MTVASTPNTSILLRMRSNRSTRSRRATACSQDVAIALEAGLVGGWAVDSRDRDAVEPEVDGELGAMVHHVIQYRAAGHRELGIRGVGAAPDLQAPCPPEFLPPPLSP